MIDLEKYYANADLEQLIAIVESADNYNKEVVDYCLQKIKEKEVPKEELKDHAKVFHQKSFFNYFIEGKHFHDEQIELNSKFLSKKELKSCFRLAKYAYRQYREHGTHGIEGYMG